MGDKSQLKQNYVSFFKQLYVKETTHQLPSPKSSILKPNSPDPSLQQKRRISSAPSTMKKRVSFVHSPSSILDIFNENASKENTSPSTSTLPEIDTNSSTSKSSSTKYIWLPQYLQNEKCVLDCNNITYCFQIPIFKLVKFSKPKQMLEYKEYTKQKVFQQILSHFFEFWKSIQKYANLEVQLDSKELDLCLLSAIEVGLSQDMALLSGNDNKHLFATRYGKLLIKDLHWKFLPSFNLLLRDYITLKMIQQDFTSAFLNKLPPLNPPKIVNSLPIVDTLRQSTDSLNTSINFDTVMMHQPFDEIVTSPNETPPSSSPQKVTKEDIKTAESIEQITVQLTINTISRTELFTSFGIHVEIHLPIYGKLGEGLLVKEITVENDGIFFEKLKVVPPTYGNLNAKRNLALQSNHHPQQHPQRKVVNRVIVSAAPFRRNKQYSEQKSALLEPVTRPI